MKNPSSIQNPKHQDLVTAEKEEKCGIRTKGERVREGEIKRMCVL